LAKFPHTQGIKSVAFDKTITVYCPLGNDFYTAQLLVEFHPNEWMMDYIDVDRFIQTMQGRNLIIEDVVKELHDHLTTEYSPYYVKVTCYATNAAHFPVTVIKE